MHDRFFSAAPDELDLASVDIETTGFNVDDIITTVVLHHDETYHIWVNLDGDEDVDIEKLQSVIAAESGFENCVIHPCSDERMLLRNIGDYVDTAFTEETLLIAYNGDTWKGGFDLPFIRTRCFRLGVSLPFKGVWFADLYKVFVKNSVFNTTVPDEPRLEDMKKADLQQFVDDTGLDVHYESMRKRQIVNALANHEDVTEEGLALWIGEEHDEEPPSIDSYKAAELKDFIDEKSLNISYNKLTKDDLITEIRQSAYTEEMLREWHEETGRDIGNRELRKLDTIHEHLVEPDLDDDEWIENQPFPVETFTPFDPYEDSGEAVTAFLNQDYEGIVLHCLADVAKTVNMSRMMTAHAPVKLYKPTIL